ncbi:MAG: metallophosphoesterase [Candidatus Lokiarchaeota archaeon]|nr:metallophosphoesterase [Candidatus Lokiarchaeota archaeon]
MVDKSWLMKLVQNPFLISSLKFEEIYQILFRVYDIFREENFIIEINSQNIEDFGYVIGDIHGNLQSLNYYTKLIQEKNPKFVVFLGDIVDRGPYQLECLILIFALKILFPQKVFLLRGNHETIEMNKQYEFYNLILTKFHQLSKFDSILMVYEVLPLCCIINTKILCVHGGISNNFNVIKQLKNRKTGNNTNLTNILRDSMFQMMWNDPKEGIQGFSSSYRGEGINFFGKDVFIDFIEKNNLRYLIRSHECFSEGYRWFFNKRLLSIFSSYNYHGTLNPNPASYAIIRGNEINPKNVKILND